MSTIVLYPANGYDFDAADVAAYLAGLTSGVFSSDEDFPVTAAGGLNITVGAGRGWVHPSRFTGYSITKREADTLTLPLADPSLPRIDRIVMRYDAGARAANLQVLQGTASSTPAAPAISRTELIYDLCLAEITRPAGSTAITTGQITDTRLDESLCGVVRDGVDGIPTDELLAAAKERINALEEKASTSAAAAKASERASAQSEQNAATSEKNAGDSETAAKQALKDTQEEHSQAVTDISTARSKTLNDIATARTVALNDVADSTKKATDAATTATEQASAAAGSATKAAGSASEAASSAGAAATSETNAKASEKSAQNWAEEAKKAANTDVTVSIEGAPADAAATRALIKKLLAQQREEDLKNIKFWASNDPTSPASFIGGTWERIEGKFIMGASDAYPAGTTGGSATHTQTVAEMPSHNHSGSTGSAGSHSHSGSTGGAGGHNHTVSAASRAASGGGFVELANTIAYASIANSTPTTSWVGNHTHTVSISSAGAHTHTVSIGSTGSGQAMNILNPYHSLYIWERVDDAA